MRSGNASVRQGTALVLGTAAIYIALFGFGTGSRIFVSVGGTLLVLTVVAWILTRALPRTPRYWVSGTAQVKSAEPPPASGTYGRCELELALAVPGLPATTALVRDSRVPVAKWPEAGSTLPVTVAVDDLRRVRIQWDDVLSHTAATTEREELDREELDREQWADHDDTYRGEPELPSFSDDEFAYLAMDDFAPSRLAPGRVLPLEDEPSNVVCRYLFPTERYRGEWRRHIARPVSRYVAVLALAVLGIVAAPERVPQQNLTEVKGAICAAGAALALYVLLSWNAGRFVLTHKRLVLVEGVLRRRVSSVALSRTTDLRYQQSALGRALNYGNFVVEGLSWFNRLRRISDLPNPNELYLRVMEESYDPRAVEARLGTWDDDGDDYHAMPTSP